MHLAIIPDGNRRYGKESGKNGHFEGMKTILKTIEWFSKTKEVEEMTIFCFSEENWNRTKEEVDYLMSLFEIILYEADYFLTHRKFSKGAEVLISDIENDDATSPQPNLTVNFIMTDTEKFPKAIKEKIDLFNKKFKDFDSGVQVKPLNLCISYTGKREIVEAVNNLLKNGQEITVENIESNLLVNSFPDLVIRSSGEKRLSGFLTWQTSYSEFMFLDKHWPDVTSSDLDECILNFKKRNRRFGK